MDYDDDVNDEEWDIEWHEIHDDANESIRIGELIQMTDASDYDTP